MEKRAWGTGASRGQALLQDTGWHDCRAYLVSMGRPGPIIASHHPGLMSCRAECAWEPTENPGSSSTCAVRHKRGRQGNATATAAHAQHQHGPGNEQCIHYRSRRRMGRVAPLLPDDIHVAKDCTGLRDELLGHARPCEALRLHTLHDQGYPTKLTVMCVRHGAGCPGKAGHQRHSRKMWAKR